MYRHVKVNPPNNLNKVDICNFSGHYCELIPLKIFELSDVLVTYEGICILNSTVVNESIPAYRDEITICSLMAQLSIIKNNTIISNDSKYYLLIHGPFFSYYHWITISIPRLLLVKSIIQKMTLILPEPLKRNNFIQESLKPFKIKDILYIPENKNLRIKHLVLPQIKPYSTTYDPKIVNEIRSLYVNYSKKLHIQTGQFTNNILFLNSKVKAEYKVNKTKEFYAFLNQHKIDIVDISDITFYEQINLIQNTKILISIGNPDLTCMSFMKKGGSILELKTEQYNENEELNLKYFNLASALKLNYYYEFCESSLTMYENKNKVFEVDLKLLEKKIKQILSI